MKKTLLAFVAFFMAAINVSAISCSVSDDANLKQKAANVKVGYEIVSEEVDFEDRKGNVEYFNITLLNVTKDLYVIMKNNVQDELRLTYYNSNNGTVEYKWYYNDSVTNFTFDVYASDETNCSDKLYNTIYITTPRYNEFSNLEICQDNAEFYMCKKYVNFEKTSEFQFQNKLNSYKKGEITDTGEEVEQTLFDKVLSFINEYKLFIISGTVLLIAGVSFGISKSNKKGRKLGL